MFVVLAGTIGVLAAVVCFQAWAHDRAHRAWAAERERLVQLTVARDGREYAVLRKASEPAPPPPEPAAPEPLQIGTY